MAVRRFPLPLRFAIGSTTGRNGEGRLRDPEVENGIVHAGVQYRRIDGHVLELARNARSPAGAEKGLIEATLYECREIDNGLFRGA